MNFLALPDKFFVLLDFHALKSIVSLKAGDTNDVLEGSNDDIMNERRLKQIVSVRYTQPRASKTYRCE